MPQSNTRRISTRSLWPKLNCPQFTALLHHIRHHTARIQSCPMLKQLRSRSTLFLLFTGSGCAGLIYAAIWSDYLKLFLGHAAYAQTLVLAMFVGGMPQE